VAGLGRWAPDEILVRNFLAYLAEHYLVRKRPVPSKPEEYLSPHYDDWAANERRICQLLNTTAQEP